MPRREWPSEALCHGAKGKRGEFWCERVREGRGGEGCVEVAGARAAEDEESAGGH